MGSSLYRVCRRIHGHRVDFPRHRQPSLLADRGSYPRGALLDQRKRPGNFQLHLHLDEDHWALPEHTVLGGGQLFATEKQKVDAVIFAPAKI